MENQKLRDDINRLKNSQNKSTREVTMIRSEQNKELNVLKSQMEREHGSKLANVRSQYEQELRLKEDKLREQEDKLRAMKRDLDHERQNNQVNVSQMQFEKNTRILKSQNVNLDTQLKDKNEEINRLHNDNVELSKTIERLETEIHKYESGFYNVDQPDNSEETERIISLYKSKMEERDQDN